MFDDCDTQEILCLAFNEEIKNVRREPESLPEKNSKILAINAAFFERLKAIIMSGNI